MAAGWGWDGWLGEGQREWVVAWVAGRKHKYQRAGGQGRTKKEENLIVFN